MLKPLPLAGFCLLLATLFSSPALAQLSGTKHIPGDYATVTAAVSALNASGVGSGGVTFDVAAGYTETISAPISITATGTSSDPIIFQKDPATSGANPLITAYTGGSGTPATASQDGIWRLVGSDYVTISGIDLTENSSNVIAGGTALMEYGFALYKQSLSNGCQNVTIQNCTITLSRDNTTTGAGSVPEGSIGIEVINAMPNAATGNLAGNATGQQQNNKFYSNTIQNVNIGIALIGSSAGASPYTNGDRSNDVGGSSSGTGNTIINFGGGASATNPSAGIRTLNQYDVNIGYNIINSNNGSGVDHPAIIRGIYNNTATGAAATISNNTVTIHGGGVASTLAGIENAAGSTANSNTISITNNLIQNGSTSSSGTFYGIRTTSTPTTISITGNTIKGNTSNSTNTFVAIDNTAATGSLVVTGNIIQGNTMNANNVFQAIANSGAVTTTINISTNQIGNATAGPVTYTVANSVGQTFISNTAGAATAALTISANTFRGITYSVTGSGSNTYISNTAATLSQTITSNVFTNLNIATSGNILFISNNVSLSGTGTQSINNNSISGTFTKATAGGTVTIYTSTTAVSASGSTSNMNGNNFSGISVTGATTIAGWVVTDTGSANRQITGNTFSNWTGGTGTITVLNLALTAAANQVAGNSILNINGGGNVNGIVVGAGNNNVFGNTVRTLSTTGASTVNAISMTAGSSNRVYNCRIYDLTLNNGTGAVNGISVSGATIVSALIYNNLIGDLKAPTANSATDVIRGIAVTATTANATINVYYNTVYIAATSTGINFSTTAVYHTANATSTTATLNLRNNIIYNVSTPNGTGKVVAYRRSSNALGNYATTSNNNLFFAGTASASHLLFYDATNSVQTLAAYKTLVSPMDAASITEDLSTKFVSTSGLNSNFLHITPGTITQVEGGAANIAGIVGDTDGQIRQGNPGYGGTGTAPDIGADEFDGARTISGTYNVGTGQTYTSLTTTSGLFAAINSLGLSGNVVVNITSDLAEDGVTALNAWNEIGVGGYTLTIQPNTTTVRNITGNVVAGMIRFNGASRVTIDGSAGTTNSYLNFQNTNGAGTTGTAFTFINGASNNTIKYSSISAFANNVNGVVLFSTSTGTTGNNNNTLSNNNIIATVGANSSSVAVYSAGTVGKENTSNTITNNSISNYRDRGLEVTATGSTGWTITGNSFFNGSVTGALDYAAGSALFGIRVSGGAGYTITGNYVGGSAALAGGANASYSSSTGVVLYDGIFLSTSSAAPASLIKGNTINAISITCVPTAVGQAVFYGIETNGSGITIGGTLAGEGNMVGSNTVNGAISITTNTTVITNRSNVRGISASSTGGSILNNQVGGFDINNGGTTPAPTFFTGVMLNNATAPTPVSGNIIGSSGGSAAANSIRVVSTSSAVGTTLTGIGVSNVVASTVLIDGNTIQNMSFLFTGGTATGITGISNTGTANSVLTISNNTISTNTTSVTAGALIGIQTAASSTSVTINNNTITNNSSTGANSGNFYGINATGGNTPTLIINSNTFSNNAAGNLSGLFAGIQTNAASTTLSINGNTIIGNTSTSTSGLFNAIYNQGAVTGSITINSNNIGNGTGGPITFSGVVNSTAQIYLRNSGAAAATTLAITGNNFQGINYTTAPSGSHTMIANSGATLSQAITANTFTNLNVNLDASFTFISDNVAVSATGTQNVSSNNIVGTFTKSAATASTVTFFTSTTQASASGAVFTHNNNNFSNITVTGSTTVAGWVITDTGTGTHTISGNTFTNWSGGTSGLTAISTNLAGTSSVSTNIINTISGAGTVTAMATAGVEGLSQNNIHTLSSSGAASAVNGISITNGSGKVFRNKIYDLQSSSATGGTVSGIIISGATLTTTTIYNNYIGDLAHTSVNSATDFVRGINITATATATINVYYNTIYINGTSSGATFSTTGVFHTANATSTVATLDMRNNIIVNYSTPKGATGRAVAFRRSAAALNNYATTSNNNLYFTSSPNANHLIHYDGANSDITLATFKARVTPADNLSVTEDILAKFLSTTGSAGLYLHIDSNQATAIESGAVNISGITDDYDGQTRTGNPGYSGPASTNPDIGADEIYGVETIPPTIVYTLLPNTASTSNVTLSNVTITDASGVNVIVGTKPRIYYKRSTDANALADNTSTTNGWKFTEATNGASPFSFTIDYSLLNGGAAGIAGSIQYFVVAQDLATVPNVGINSGTFANQPTSVALTTNAFPLTGTINSYSITFTGTYNVGSTEIYTSLTKTSGLFAAINAAGLAGNIVVNVTSNLAEDGAVALNAWTETGPGNYTLTIQPSAATFRTISGDAVNGLIRFNDADRVTIDGRSGGSGSYLKFINTNGTVTTGAAITFVNGASNNTIEYADIEAVTNSTTGAVFFSTSSSSTGNTNNVIDNCTITSTVGAQTGSVAVYSAGTTGKENSTISITNNTIHGYSDRAIDVTATGSSVWTITNNSIYNGDITGLIPAYASGSTLHGIRILGGAGHNITNNFIGGSAANATGSNAVYQSSTGDVSFQGILLSTSSASPASSIKGNTITAITVSSIPTSANSVTFVGIETGGSGISIGGASVGEGNTIGSTSTNGTISVTTTTSSATNTSAVTGINAQSTGGSIVANNISGIDVTNVGATPAGSTVRGIRLNNATAMTPVSANIVGSTSLTNSIRITSSSTAPSPVLQGISIGATVASPVSVDNNTIQNLSNLSTTSSGSFAGISSTASTSAALTITNNSIQTITTGTNASVNSGIYNAIFSQSPSTISNNTINSITVSATGTAVQLRGIAVSGAVAHTISNNTISNLSTASTKVAVVETGDPAGFALMGILNSATTSGQVISGNTLFSLTVSSNAHTNVVIGGIAVDGASSSGNIFQNRVHGLINNSTGSLTLPGMVGVMAFDGSYNLYNNAIRADNAANTNAVRVYAVVHATSNTWNYIYNTLVVSGSGAGTTRSAAFTRTVTGPVLLKNNILLNTRTFIGPNFAISNPGGATNWSGTASDYNDIFTSSNASNTGEWGASAVTFAQWQSMSTGDSHSVTQTATFIASTHDLALNTSANCLMNNSATPISSPIVISIDLPGVTRSATPDMGAYEFDFVSTTVGASNDSPVCAAALVNLSADPGTLTSPTYSWQDPTNAVISTLRNPAVSAIAGIYTVTIKDGTGCPYIATTTVTVTARPTAVISGSTVICNGSTTSLQLDVTGTGTLNGTLSSGDVFTGPTPQILLPVSPTTTTVYTIASLKDDNCTSIPADLTGTATITVTPGGDWGGASDGDWNNAANWCGGVPTSSVNVHIASGTPFSPTISSPGALAQTLTIDVGAALDMNGTGTLDLKGDLTNNGDFNIGSGTTVSFSGTSTQSITGTLMNFSNMNVTNTASPGLQIESDQNLLGVLTLGTDVIFDADGSANTSVFTLKSFGDKPTKDASIAALPSGATVTGNVTVERFMSIYAAPNDRIYRYISAPVVNATVADIQNEIYVSGTFTGASTCTGCGGQSMFGYDETVITDSNHNGIADSNDGYVNFPVSSNTETFVSGKGYTIFVRGNLLPSALWNLTGTIAQGNVTPVTMPVSFTSSGVIANDGWNLVGNPYPSAIDWNASGWTKSNLGASIYVTDNSGPVHQYATWNGVTGTNGGTRYIALGQGFFVKANGSGTPILNASETVKTSTQTTYFREGAPENLLRITLRKGNVRDEAVIHFREDATADFDSQADALKLPNQTFNLGSMSNNLGFAINSLPLQGCTSSIKLNITSAAAGSYTLDFSEYESFGNTVAISLVDNLTSTTTDVLSTPTYNFTITAATNTFGSGRFVLNFVSKKYDATAANGIVCTEGSTQLVASGAPADGRYNWYDSQNSQVALQGNTNIFTTPSITEPTTYFVAAVDRWGCEGPRVSVLADVKKPADATITEAAGVLTSSYTTGNQWFLNDVALDGQTGATFTPVKTGSYKVQVTTTDGCQVTSTSFDFTVPEPPVIPVTPPPVDTVTGLEEDSKFSVKFMPNPVSDKLTVVITGANSVTDIRISNQLGQIVGRIPVQKSASRTTGEIGMKDLPAGVYIIQVIGDNLVHTERVVKL